MCIPNYPKDDATEAAGRQAGLAHSLSQSICSRFFRFGLKRT